MTLFVDTSIWYAAADRGDRGNRRAKEVLQRDERFVTSDHVLVETWFLLRHRLGERAARRFWEGLRTGIAAVEHVTPGDLEAAWAIGERYPDQDFSIVDRTSFALLQRIGVHRVATLDSDFGIYRFGPGSRLAFEVVL